MVHLSLGIFLMMLLQHGDAIKFPAPNSNAYVNNNNELDHKSLSFSQYRTILTFNNENEFSSQSNTNIDELNNDATTTEMESETTTQINDLWDTMLLDAWGLAEETEISSSSAFTNEEKSHVFPFVLCHLDESSTCGEERYELIESLLREEKGNSDVDFFLDEIPIYNHIFSKEENGKEKDEEYTDKKLNGACFYSSMTSSIARRISSHDMIYATPLSSSLKTRKSSFLNNLNEKDDSEIQIPRALSIYTSPGVFLSHHKAKEILTTFSDSSKTTCSNDFNAAFSVSASSIDKSHFFFEIQDEKQDRVTHECLELLIDYLTEKSDIISVDLVMKTFLLNEIASWIIQGSPEVNTLPWYDLGLDGSGEIVQVSDSGLDESHCYLKDKNGVVPLTEDFDITGKIDNSKRKVIQYVALSGIGDRTDYSQHGSHVVGTILGKRSDDGVNEVTGLIDGIAPASKVTFFDATDNQEDDKISIPLDISQMFYFGKQSQAFAHSASWGSNSDGGQYSSRVREVDQYFYESEDDDFIMFLAAGNDGTTNGAKIDDPSASKNAISVGASHSYGKNLYDNMKGFEYVASFSSRGPTADNRIKPDIIAPGHSVLSIKAGSNGECDPDYRPQYMGPGNKDHAGLTFKSGTSMSCPVVVGAGALIRQYFREIHNPSMDISGTLLKAVLINGAEALIGRSKSTYGSESEPSTLYDKSQGFGKLNLLNSLKHPSPSIDSPDVHVEDARVLQHGQSHEYEFDVCDAHDFRVTVVWQDPPGQVGCAKCLVNDLDLEVLYDGKTYYPNGRTSRDSRNNVERVILSRDDISSSDSNSVIIRVEARNLGFGKTQKYSLASTGCIDTVDFISTTPSPTTSCGSKQFECELKIFTDRKPEETSWTLAYQDQGGIVDVARVGDYDQRLKLYTEQSCLNFGCFIFIIKDAEFNGLCCEKGMGFYQISTEDKVLLEGSSFYDRQEINKFCYFGKEEDNSAYEEPTTSPTFSCDEDEVEYELEITTDLYPDETKWKLTYPRIDGVMKGYYTKENTEYVHETGCLDYGCYEFTYSGYGRYKIFAEGDALMEGYEEETKEFCFGPSYSYNPSLQPSTTQNPSTKLSENPSSSQSPSQKPSQPPSNFPTLQPTSTPSIGCDENEILFEVLISTEIWPEDISWELKYEDGTLIHSIEKGYYRWYDSNTEFIYPFCLRLECFQISMSIYWRYGGYTVRVGNYIIVEEKSFYYTQTRNFCYSGETNSPSTHFPTISPSESLTPSQPPTFFPSQIPTTLSPTHSQSPTSNPSMLVCSADEYKFEVAVNTDSNPHEVFWKLYNVSWQRIFWIDQGYYTVSNREYIHSFCVSANESCFKFRINRSSGYTVRVGDHILAKSKASDNQDFCYGPSFSNSPSTLLSETPSFEPTLKCNTGQFQYRVSITTIWYWPEGVSWELYPSRIDSIPYNHYRKPLEQYKHHGCLKYDRCFEFRIEDRTQDGLCCYFGNGSYKLSVGNKIMFEDNQLPQSSMDTKHSDIYEIKEFCVDRPETEETPTPSITFEPTLSFRPSESACGENEFELHFEVTTDYNPSTLWWWLASDKDSWISCGNCDATYIPIREPTYFLQYHKYTHKYCVKHDQCFHFYFGSSDAVDYVHYGTSRFKFLVGDTILAQGKSRRYQYKHHRFCYGPSVSNSPSSQLSSTPSSSSPTFIACDDNKIKYEVVVSPYLFDGPGTSWTLSYENGTIIDSVDRGYYNDDLALKDFVHTSCLDYLGCFEFTISYYSQYSIWSFDGTYKVKVGDYILMDGGAFEQGELTTPFCYFGETNPPTISQSPSTLTPTIVCDRDEFRYEIILSTLGKNGDYWRVTWSFEYRYPRSREIDDWRNHQMYREPNTDYYHYGCAKYDSCFQLRIRNVYMKVTDMNTGIVIAQNIESYEDLRFCHYAPKLTPSPTMSKLPSETPIISPNEAQDAIFTISLIFSSSPSDIEDISAVVKISVSTILDEAISSKSEESFGNILVNTVFSICEEFMCDFSFQVCERSCDIKVEPNFMAFVANTINEAMANGIFIQTLEETADDLDVDAFDTLVEILPVDFDFEYQAWPTTSPTKGPMITLAPSTTPTLNACKPTIASAAENISEFVATIVDIVFGVDFTFLYEITAGLFGEKSNINTTEYPTPVPSPYPTETA